MAVTTLSESLATRGLRVTRDASIADLVTYRLGGPVAALVRIGTESELAAVAEVVAELRPPVLVVGRGSNLLVADEGFAGLGVVLDGVYDEVELGATTRHSPAARSPSRCSPGGQRRPASPASSSSSASPARWGVPCG